jgi:O-antigen ligase
MLRLVARRLLWLEVIILSVLLYAFWFTDASRVLTLALLVPILVLRWVAYRRVITLVPLVFVFVTLLILAVISVYAAPYSWGNVTIASPPFNFRSTVPWAWVMIGRPLLGMAIVFALVEHAREYGIRGVLVVTLVLALLVGFAALFATQWNTKSAPLRFITDLLRAINPLPTLAHFPIAGDLVRMVQGGFNANEIGGAIAWLTPVCAGIALYRWRPRAIQIAAGILFFVLLLALFLGQSRLALAGVVVALGAMIFLLIPHGRYRYLALAGLILFGLLEGALVAGVFSRDQTQVEALQDRDEVGATHRMAMWHAALNAVRDYPLTGLGMNLYRNGTVRARYPVPTYENRVLPHAHNEYLQIAADLGIPGLLVFIALYGVAGWMAWRCWRSGDVPARVVAVAAAGGLLAHGIYGLGDAITLWDRFAFVFWWLLGIISAQYVVVRDSTNLLLPND